MTTNIIKRNNGTSTVPARQFNSWVDQLLHDNLNRFFNDDLWGFSGINQQGNVPVNLRETDKTYEMSLVAPGLRKEDFRLNVTDNLLTISYEQKEEQKEEGWLRKEYRMQSFSRSFTLDDTVDVNKVAASYDNGILHLTIPKKESAQRITKTIEIK